MKWTFVIIMLLTSFGLVAQAVDCPIGDGLYENNRYSKAIRAYNQCLTIDSSRNILLRLGQSHTKLARYKQSANVYEQLYIKNREDIQVLNLLAQTYNKLGKLKYTRSLYTQLTKLDPENFYYYKKLGDVCYDLGSFQMARVNYEQCVKLDSNSIYPRYKVAKVYQKMKVDYLAIEVLNEALAIVPEDQNSLLLMAKIQFKKEAYDSASKYLEKYISLDTDTLPYAARLLGVSYYHLNQFEESIRLLNYAVKKEMDKEGIYFYLAKCYEALGDLNNSNRYYSKAIQEGKSQYLPTYYMGLAKILEEQNRYDKAIEMYDKAYETNKYKLVFFFKGRLYEKLNKTNQALSSYETFLYHAGNKESTYKAYASERVGAIKKEKHFQGE